MNQQIVTIEDAFEVLQVAVEKALAASQEDVAEAIRARDFDGAQHALDHTRALSGLREKVEQLQSEFGRLIGEAVDADEGHRRLRAGLRTPDVEYYRPILEAITELGGSANLNDVLELVYDKMRDQLNEHDRAPLPSDGVTPRWRNAAQWARYNLRQQGMLRDDSPRGVWEISDQGRAWLEEN